MLRFAARLLILAFLFQGALFLVPTETRAQVAPCDATYYPLADHLGSVNVLTDSAGIVVMRQHFLPFGEEYESPKPIVPEEWNNNEPWPYGFTGQYHDVESGLIYMHARYYNPVTGHFMSPDSVIPNPSDTYSYDRYAYCRNNPVNLVDPTGHMFWLAALGIAALVTAGATFVATLVTGGTVGQAATNALIAGGSTFLFGIYAGPIVTAVIQANRSGGNLLQAALIAGLSMGIGVGVGTAVGAISQHLSSGMQGFLNVMSSGVVGGALSSAMGGDFWQGFIGAAAAAGVSLAAARIADRIENQQEAAREDDSRGKGTSRAGLPSRRHQLEGDPNVPPAVEKAAQDLEATSEGTAKTGTNNKNEADTRYLESTEAAIVLKDGTVIVTHPWKGEYTWGDVRGVSWFGPGIRLEIKTRVPDPSNIKEIYLMHPHADPKGVVISWYADAMEAPRSFVRSMNNLYGSAGSISLDQVRVLVPNWQGDFTLANPATGQYYYYTP